MKSVTEHKFIKLIWTAYSAFQDDYSKLETKNWRSEKIYLLHIYISRISRELIEW